MTDLSLIFKSLPPDLLCVSILDDWSWHKKIKLTKSIYFFFLKAYEFLSIFVVCLMICFLFFLSQEVLSTVTFIKLLACCQFPEHCSKAFWLITPQIISTLIVRISIPVFNLFTIWWFFFSSFFFWIRLITHAFLLY